MAMIKTVFHVHTDHSSDSNQSVEDVLAEARRRSVGCITITDHDCIEGAQRAAALADDDLAVIVGQEISTTDGHLIGLFLRERVEPRMSVRRTAAAIRDQGGLVVVPHPFNSIFSCGLRDSVFDILDLIDAVEIANAQNLRSRPNRRAEEFARRHGCTMIVGSDTHHRGYLDTCYQMMRPFDGPAAFLASLQEAEFHAARHPLIYFVKSGYLIARYGLGFGVPKGYGRNAQRAKHHTHTQRAALPAD
jgi:predicted metal-dependent phosphoesterase TrpH